MNKSYREDKKKVAYLFSGDTTVGAVTSMKRIVDNIDTDRFMPFLFSSSNGNFYQYLKTQQYTNLVDLKLKNGNILRWFNSINSNIIKIILFFIPILILLYDFFRIQFFVVKYKIDVLHPQDIPSCMLSSFIFGTKKVWHIRGIVNVNYLWGLGSLILAYFAKNTSKIIAISKSVKNSLRGIDEQKIVVIYNAIELSHSIDINKNIFLERMPIQCRRKKLIAVVGRFTENKGILLFVEMANLLKKYIDEYHFVIVAPLMFEQELQYKDKVIQTLERYSLKDSVTLVGAFENCHYFMGNFFLLVVPTIYKEGFGNVVIEAHSYGIPVIATQCGGPSEIIINGKTGIVVEENTPIALAKSVESLMNDNGKYNTMSKNACRRANETQFRVKNMIKKIESLYFTI